MTRGVQGWDEDHLQHLSYPQDDSSAPIMIVHTPDARINKRCDGTWFVKIDDATVLSYIRNAEHMILQASDHSEKQQHTANNTSDEIRVRPNHILTIVEGLNEWKIEEQNVPEMPFELQLMARPRGLWSGIWKDDGSVYGFTWECDILYVCSEFRATWYAYTNSSPALNTHSCATRRGLIHYILPRCILVCCALGACCCLIC